MGSRWLGRKDDILTRQFASNCNLSFTARLIFLESSQKQRGRSEDVRLSLPALNHFTSSTAAHRNIPKIFKIFSVMYLIAEDLPVWGGDGGEHIFLEITEVQDCFSILPQAWELHPHLPLIRTWKDQTLPPSRSHRGFSHVWHPCRPDSAWGCV